jgi:hypothetical protein
MDNIVECIYRKYRVQTPGGMIIEVESDKPLSTQLNAKLLEEEPEIDEFFKYHNILGTRQIIKSNINPQKTRDIAEPRIISRNGTLSPRQRLNQLVKMKGEFTRQDYIDSLFTNFKYKLNKWTSHNDIKDALRLNKIQTITERKGQQRYRVYKVVDDIEVEESIYEKLLQDRKQHISTLT